MVAGNSLSIIIIAGNEEKIIGDCLKSALFANEIIVCHNSTDNTVKIVKEICPRAIVEENKLHQHKFDFSVARNFAFKLAHSRWILYLDADERIPQNLKEEIQAVINKPDNQTTNYDIPRANYFLGKRVRHGGTYPDYVKRLFRRDKFKGYTGTVHEQPSIIGPSSALKNSFIHLTHRNLTSMLEKSIKWTRIEAEMLHNSHHPPVVWWRFPRMMLTTFYQRFIRQQMWRDGTVGLISATFESFNTFMIYARLWEMQQATN